MPIIEFAICFLVLCIEYLVESLPVSSTESFNYAITTSPLSNTWIFKIFVPVLACLVIIIIGITIYILVTHQFEKIKYERIEPKPLINDAELCYLNSMVQALASSDLLITNYKKLIERFEKGYKITKLQMFVQILESINDSSISSNRKTSDNLQKLLEAVAWNKPSQQDAFQLLSALINGIQVDLRDLLEEKTMPPKFRILHSFSENPKFNKIQDHLALAIPLCGDYANRPGVELTTMIDAFFEPSFIDDGLHSTSMSLFDEAPEVLILHIQANEWSHDRGEYIKPTYFIKYEDTLEYTFTIHKKVDGLKFEPVIIKYRLRAVVKHMGNVQGGHYVTYRMCDGKWFLTNDEQVEEITFNYDIVPYIMVYDKL